MKPEEKGQIIADELKRLVAEHFKHREASDFCSGFIAGATFGSKLESQSLLKELIGEIEKIPGFTLVAYSDIQAIGKGKILELLTSKLNEDGK